MIKNQLRRQIKKKIQQSFYMLLMCFSNRLANCIQRNRRNVAILNNIISFIQFNTLAPNQIRNEIYFNIFIQWRAKPIHYNSHNNLQLAVIQ